MAEPAMTGEMSEAPEASTPFASAVDLHAEGSEPSEGVESDSDRPTFVSPWWRRLSAPSRPVMVGALVAAVAAGLGWTAGAKPWASHRSHTALAAKGGSKHTPVAARGTPAHGTPAHGTPAHGTPPGVHANRRVAVNGKSKTAPAAAPAPKGNTKPISAAKHVAAPAPGAAGKASANKVSANKAPAKPAPGKAKTASLVGKSKGKATTAPAKSAKPAGKAAKPKAPASK